MTPSPAGRRGARHDKGSAEEGTVATVWSDCVDGDAPATGRDPHGLLVGYLAQVAAVCKGFPTCRYDGRELYRMKLVAGDLAFDEQHLSVAGHRKQATLEWKSLAQGRDCRSILDMPAVAVFLDG